MNPKPLKPKYKVGDIVILREGQAMARVSFPKGQIEVEIKTFDFNSSVVRYFVVLNESKSSMRYICLESEIIRIKIFNPSRRKE